MKGFFNFIIILALIIGGWILYVNYSEQKQTESQNIPQNTNQSPVQSPQAPANRHVNQQNNAPVNSPDKRGIFANCAATAGCSIVSYEQTQKSAIITVESRDRNALGNFLDECMKIGMTDFSTVKNMTQAMRDNTTYFSTTYKVMWR